MARERGSAASKERREAAAPAARAPGEWFGAPLPKQRCLAPPGGGETRQGCRRIYLKLDTGLRRYDG